MTCGYLILPPCPRYLGFRVGPDSGPPRVRRTCPALPQFIGHVPRSPRRLRGVGVPHMQQGSVRQAPDVWTVHGGHPAERGMPRGALVWGVRLGLWPDRLDCILVAIELAVSHYVSGPRCPL